MGVQGGMFTWFLYLWTTLVQCPWRPEEGRRVPCGCWELNPEPGEEHPMLLTSATVCSGCILLWQVCADAVYTAGLCWCCVYSRLELGSTRTKTGSPLCVFFFCFLKSSNRRLDFEFYHRIKTLCQHDGQGSHEHFPLRLQFTMDSCLR